MEERRIAQEIELHSYLTKLISDDKDAQMKKIHDEESSDNEKTEGRIMEIEEKIVRMDTLLCIVTVNTLL